MIFFLICLVFVVGAAVLFKKCGVRNPFSKSTALAISLSLAASVCLAQNYTQSLVPQANDGIGISNRVAYWIIGEDGWSRELFRAYFENAVYLTLFLIVVYPAVLSLESRWSERRKSSGMR